MTREEEILNKAIDYSEIEENFLEYDDCGDVCDDKMFIERAFVEGAKWADKTVIEKVCKWLKQSEDNYYKYDTWKGDYCVDFDALIDDLKKVMEE